MGKLYTFGCSFTKYFWPTWADILLTHYEGENWGLPGGGNKFIFESIIECHVTNKIKPTDTVIVMWTSWAREDRYNNGWRLAGNVYNNPFYDKDFLMTHWNDEGAVLDSLNWISATYQLLDLIGCNYVITSAYPFYQVRENTGKLGLVENLVDTNKFIKYLGFIESYKSRTILDCLYQEKYQTQTTFNKVPWDNKPCSDNHPLPLQHHEWLENNILDKLNLSLDVREKIKYNTEYMHNVCLQEFAKTNYVHPVLGNYTEINKLMAKEINRVK